MNNAAGNNSIHALVKAKSLFPMDMFSALLLLANTTVSSWSHCDTPTQILWVKDSATAEWVPVWVLPSAWLLYSWIKSVTWTWSLGTSFSKLHWVDKSIELASSSGSFSVVLLSGIQEVDLFAAPSLGPSSNLQSCVFCPELWLRSRSWNLRTWCHDSTMLRSQGPSSLQLGPCAGNILCCITPSWTQPIC